MSKDLIWVNENDQVTGYGEKIETHRIEQLHRAFSIFIIDPSGKRMLLQRRAFSKYHSGGKWSNSCCSHPYRGESWGDALSRCLLDELGLASIVKDELAELFESSSDLLPALSMHSKISYCGSFHYYSSYGELAEHEMDHVFLYFPSQKILDAIIPNPEEIHSLTYLPLCELDRRLADHPEDFSTWFAPAYHLVRDKLPL